MRKNFILIYLVTIFFWTGINAQNNSIEFDGTEDYVNCGNIPAGGSNSYTCSAWVYADNPANASGWQGIIYHGLSGESQAHMGLNISGYLSGGSGNSNTGDWETHVTSYQMPTTAWVFLTMVIDRNAESISFYANGTFIESFSHSVVPNSTTDPLTIGLGSGGEYFDGKVDEVRIWNSVLTETEIRQNMYRELPDPAGETNLLAYYKCNEIYSSTLTDTKGSYNGTLVNMTGEEFVTSSAIFGPKNCLDFDGTDDWISTTATMPSVYTKEAWVYIPSENGKDNNIVSGGPSDGTHAFWISQGYSYKLSAGHNGVWNAVQDPNQIPFGSWQHIAVTYSSGTMTLYRNGIQVDQANGVAAFTGGTVVRIGTFGENSNLLGGKLDEVRIWSDVRSETEIRENMCKKLTGNEDNLVAYYSFDNYSGTVLQDFSGNGNDGTLNNMDENSDWVSSFAFNTWLNTSSTAWSTNSNWSGGSPTSNDNVGIYSYSGGSTPSFTNGDEATVGNIVVDMSSDWSIGGNFSVSGNLILESDLNLNGQTIYLGSTGYLIEDAGLLYGSSGSITTTRILTNINENVAGLGAEITTSADMGSTTISRSHAALSDPVSIERIYSISPSNNSGLDATLVFHYHTDELNELSESSVELLKSTDGGISWVSQGGLKDITNNTITRDALDSFSNWTIGETMAPVLETQNPSNTYYPGTSSITIASALTITYSENLSSATVSITPIISNDVLSVTSLPEGLSSSWDNTGKILTISGDASASDYQTALRLVKFESTSTTSGTRTIDFSLGDGVGLTINSQKHFYEVVNDGSHIDWTDARTAALSSVYAGTSGYLVTIMSETEGNYIAEKVSENTWIGASDNESQGVWKWMDGPEAGEQFWQGQSTGYAVGGLYNNWATGEPNNAYNYYHDPKYENFAHIYGSNNVNAGLWNDFWNDESSVTAYLIEYGGDGTVFTTMDDATIEVENEFSWDGSEGTDWNTAANWSFNEVPSMYCNITIPDVTNGPIIEPTDTVNCNDMVINSGASLTIASDATGTGSLVVKGSVTGNITVQRYLSQGKWHYISEPVNTDGNFDELSLGLTSGVGNDQFYRWEESLEWNSQIGTWVDILNGPDGNNSTMGTEGFVSCKGYSISYNNANTTLNLEGVPYTTSQSISLTKTNESSYAGSNLIGNPFCSSIAINSNADADSNFIDQNSASLDATYQAVYIWNEGGDWSGGNADYDTYNNASSAFYAAPGQAFMVMAANNGANINFNTSIRKHSNTDFYKNSNNNPHLKLMVTGEKLYNSTEIAFIPGMTNGHDRSYDAGKLKGNPDISLYTRLVEDNGIDYAIQALNNLNVDSYTIPVGVDISEETVLEFSIIQANLEQDIYLEDRLLNTSVNLSSQNYSAYISESGTGRFFIHFAPVGINETNYNQPIHAYSDGSNITILNNDNLYGMVRVVNIMGQEVTSFRLDNSDNSTYSFDIPCGIYIVYIETNNGNIYSDKIIIQ